MAAATTMRTTGLALQVVVVAVLLLSVVLGAAARSLDGDSWVVVGAAGAPLPGGGVASTIVEGLRRLYLQQLGGPGASCTTNSPNNGCPP